MQRKKKNDNKAWRKEREKKKDTSLTGLNITSFFALTRASAKASFLCVSVLIHDPKPESTRPILNRNLKKKKRGREVSSRS